MGDKTLRLMVDYGTWPLWDSQGNVDHAKLPISEELKKRLPQKYDNALDHEYPPNSGFASAEAEEAFLG
jgi:hypothetical protein